MRTESLQNAKFKEVKMKDIKFEVLREHILSMQICCNLSPDEMRGRKKGSRKTTS